MIIQKCQNCGTEFKYKTKTKGLWNSSIECNNCGACHRVTSSSRTIFAILLVGPVLLLNVFDFTIFSTPMSKTAVYLIYAAIIIALSPYIYRYRLNSGNKNNP